jgi:hypothetical protein
MAPQDRVLYGKMMGMSQKTARGRSLVSVMHLAQRFYKTVNDMPAARGRDVLDSSKELSIPLSNHVESQDLREIAAFDARIWTSSKRDVSVSPCTSSRHNRPANHNISL